jgi:tetratricopeptide (TPR) repeat protein
LNKPLRSKNNPSFWTTVPGILTGIAAILGSMTGLLVATGYFPQPQGYLHALVNNSKTISEVSNNLTPVANAGANKTVLEGDRNVTLDGSSSLDPDGDKLIYLWRQISGDLVNVKNSNKVVATFDTPNITKDTLLTFQLTVEDNKGLKSNANVGILLQNNETNDPLLFNLKGSDFDNLHRYNDAINYYNKTLAIDSNNVDALNNIGIDLNNMHRYNESITYLDKVLSIDPKNDLALINKASDLLNMHRYNESITYLDRALAVDPKNRVSLTDKGIDLFELGDTDKAMYYYKKVLSIDPHFESALISKQEAENKINKK